MRKNKDVVAYVPSLDCHWMFDVPLTGPRVSDMHAELLQLFEQVFYVVDGWLQPQNAEYTLLHYDEDISANKFFQSEHSSGSIEEIHLDSSDPTQSFLTKLGDTTSHDRTEVISRFIVNQAATKIKLDKRDEYVDMKSTESYVWWLSDGPIDRQPTSDPIEVHVRLRRPTTSGNPPVARIIFESYTDIWFEETDIGEVNRQRLAGVLRHLAAVLDQTGAWFHSNQYGEDRLEQLGLDDTFVFG